jgi:diguanylate cyclase (GGDEF)-like protein
VGIAVSGIRARLLLLVGLALGPLFVFTLYQGLQERRRAAVRERVDARRLVRLFAADHGRVIADAHQLLSVLALVPVVQRGDPETCARLFHDVLAGSPDSENLLLADVEGIVVASAQPASLDAEDRALVALAEASPFAVGPIRFAGPATVPTFSVVHAVSTDPRAPKRVLVTKVAMRWVAREVAVAALDAPTRVTLWDSSGRILLRLPDPEGALGRDASTSEVWQSMLATRGEGTAEAAGDDGVRRLYGFTRLPGEGDIGGAFLSLGVPIDVAFADLRRFERRNLLILAVMTALAAGVGLLGGERLVRLFGRMQRMAERDSLTGLPNRRRLIEVGQAEQGRARRYGHPLAAVMIDLDHFKAVNDRLGHGAGDDVLREAAHRIQATLRATDLAVRYGGEEFAVLLPETALETAWEAAERIRLAVGEAPIKTRRGPVTVTLSAGVAALDEHTGDLKRLFEAADLALYAAKAAGRNRVSSASPSGLGRA